MEKSNKISMTIQRIIAIYDNIKELKSNISVINE